MRDKRQSYKAEAEVKKRKASCTHGFAHKRLARQLVTVGIMWRRTLWPCIRRSDTEADEYAGRSALAWMLRAIVPGNGLLGIGGVDQHTIQRGAFSGAGLEVAVLRIWMTRYSVRWASAREHRAPGGRT